MLRRLSGTITGVLIAFNIISANGLTGKSETGYPRLMQGPMIGYVTETSISVWMRGSWEVELQVAYDTDPLFANPKMANGVRVSKDTQYVATVLLENLQPGTTYYYRPLIDGQPDRYQKILPPYTVRTAPKGSSRFRVAYGSCPVVQRDRIQPIWTAVHRLRPDLFFWIGDNIYGDSLDPDILFEEYMRQREVDALQPLLRSVPQLALWDDHDFGLNNHDRTNPIKAEALEVFTQVWSNPGYGLTGTPGVFFQYHYGGVDFFFLDNRYHRDPNEAPPGPGKTHLGKAQLAWLKSGLRQSEAAFKVLIAGGGWVERNEPGIDTWSSFIDERNDLFNTIRDEAISGVILLSGNSHRGELNCAPWSENGGYDFYDLVSSPLAQPSSTRPPREMPDKSLRRIFGRANAGVLDFDMTLEDPRLTFQLYDERGAQAWKTFVIHASELVNGVSSWKGKLDDTMRDYYQSRP